MSKVRAVLTVFRAASENPALRKVGCAYALCGASEFGVWIALLIFAYGHGGADAGLFMVVVQLIPCVATSPFLGAITDRQRPGQVLCVGYGLQALSLGAVALAIAVRAPVPVVFALSPLTALSFTVTRPAQAALLPAIVGTPSELTAANVMTAWTDAGAALLGPTIVGVLVAWGGLGLAVAAMAGMTAVSTLLLAPVAGSAAPRLVDDSSGALIQDGDRVRKPQRSGIRESLAFVRTGARANVMLAVRNPAIRILLSLHAFYYTLVGALDLLCVILAVTYLHMGPGGPGFLNSALGGGALCAGFITAFLVGRRRLAGVLAVGLAMAVAPLALINVIHGVTPTVLLIGAVGLAGAVFDTTGRTLLQRSCPSDAIAGSFSILEALMDGGLVVGAIVVRVALAIGGLRAALFAPAVVACLLLGGLWRQLRKIDSSATVPHVEIRLLRSIPIFAALPAPSLEGLARDLGAMVVPPGTVVVKEGEAGDCYYAVAEGKLAVSLRGRFLRQVSRGDGFGEIALIRDVPRTATVTALTDASLYTLHKEPFLQSLTGHVTAITTAEAVVARHLDNDPVD